MKPEWLLVILLSVLIAGTARPGEVILDSPLNNLDLRETSLTRLEMRIGGYRGNSWTGLRNIFSIERPAGASSGWCLTLPWIYSSADAGLGRRGNLHGGFAWSPPALSFLRFGGEAWLPFSDDRLAPLQIRRSFMRWSLRTRAGFGAQDFRFCLSRTAEIRGLIGEEEGEPWVSWNEGEARWSFTGWKHLRPQLSARAAFREGEVLWTEAGGGISLHWTERWSLEVAAAAFISDLDDPFPTARLRLELRRDFPDPVFEDEEGVAEDLSEMAEDAMEGGENEMGADETPAPPPPGESPGNEDPATPPES